MPDQPIGFLASQVVRAIRQLVAAQVEPLGLSTQQFWTIVAIAEHASGSQCELAERMRVDEATACRVLRTLGDAGLTTAIRDPGDRRRVRLELSPRGEALARRLVPVAHDIRNAIDTSISPGERAAVQAALGKVLARLSSLIESAPQGTPPPGSGVPRRRAARSTLSTPRNPDRTRSHATRRGSP